jgi:5-(carboxyamino)imidazole ribonucleotide synthase
MKKIGILGGGQLGLMSYQASLDLNFEMGFLDPDPSAPCSGLPGFVCGSLQDESTILDFGQKFEVISIEIEKVNVSALEKLAEKGIQVYPPAAAISIIQDKIKQKQYYQEKGYPTAAFHITQNKEELKSLLHFLPAVHKLGRDGYDGRGVQMLENDISQAFDAPSVLEQKVEINKELSVIVARNASGQVQSFPVVEQVFHPKGHLLDYLLAPAQISPELAMQAQQIAESLTVDLQIVGLLSVEFFFTKQGHLLINEVAPRPHNSGHHSIEANHTSQFQQFVRAIAGLPLGKTDMKVPFAAVVNLLGQTGQSGKANYLGMVEMLEKDGFFPHLYAKAQTKPLRKMGHVTILADTLHELKTKVEWAKQNVKVVAV